MVVKISDQRSIPHAEADRGTIRRCRECTTGLILLATWCPELSRSILVARCAALHSIQKSPKIDHCGREERAPKFCERQRPLIRAGFQKMVSSGRKTSQGLAKHKCIRCLLAILRIYCLKRTLRLCRLERRPGFGRLLSRASIRSRAYW